MLGVLHTDGAAFGNPGPGGIGCILYLEGDSYEEVSEPIGYSTNNEAEYKAMMAGLDLAKRCDVTELTVRADSLLVVNQVKGLWKTKEARLEKLRDEVRAKAKHFEKITFEHVPREENQEADALSKRGAEANR